MFSMLYVCVYNKNFAYRCGIYFYLGLDAVLFLCGFELFLIRYAGKGNELP